MPTFCITLPPPPPQGMNVAAKNLREFHRPNLTIPADAFMGGYHFVTTLDFLQHEPPGANPLFKFVAGTAATLMKLASNPRADNFQDAQGRLAWLKVDIFVLLQEQHQFNMDTPGGKKLYQLVQVRHIRSTLTLLKGIPQISAPTETLLGG